MRFLLDANLPRAAVAIVEKFGHTAEFARDAGLGSAPGEVIAERARSTQAALITRDLDSLMFVAIRQVTTTAS